MNNPKLAPDCPVIRACISFLRDAERMAEVTAAFLDRHGRSLQDGQQGWSGAFLMELGAVLRLHQWQVAGIKDAIDASLPSSDAAFADLGMRLQTEPESFIRGEAPLYHRVVFSWWQHCAHPVSPMLDVDIVLSPIHRDPLLSSVVRLLWALRDVEIPSTIAN